MMPLLGLVLLLCVLLGIIYRKSNKSIDESEENFWDRERAANTTIRRDITDLPYITIPLDKFPLDFEAGSDGALLIKDFKNLSEKKILNLTDKTNTDLKLEYGLNNLETMQEIGENYNRLTIIIRDLASLLIEQNRIDEAVRILEYGVSIKSDISANYTMLGDCYMKQGQERKIQTLIEQVNLLNLFMGPTIIKHLESLLCPSSHTDSEDDQSLETSQSE